MGFWRIVFTILIPPLGVLLGKGFGWAFIINILLTLLGYKAKARRATVNRYRYRSVPPLDQTAA